MRAHADLAPTLAGLDRARSATSPAPCPSTTPVSLATLGTGLPPGSHGILGFVTDVPGEDRTLNHVQWGDDPDPDVWQPRRTAFQQVETAGIPATAVGPYAYAGSGLTRSVYRGAAYPGSVRPGDLVAQVLGALAATPRALVYGYLPELDLTGHVRGVDSASWRAQLRPDRPPRRAARRRAARRRRPAGHRRPRDARRPSRTTRLDLDAEPDLDDGVRLLAGEPRARYVHAEPGAAADVLDRAGAASSATGPGWPAGTRRSPAASSAPWTTPLAARIGDVVALARGTWAFTAPSASPAPAGWSPTTARSPRRSWRSRCCSPAARARLSPTARRATCQVRECAGWVARQVSRSASAEGRLSTAATTSRPARPG